MTLGTGSGATSPDPADHGDSEVAYQSWCDHHDLDPYDDDNRDRWEAEMAWFPDGEEWK